jgi:hypothetical protein
MSHNRLLERKKGVTRSEKIYTSRNQWLVETRWSKLEKDVIV